MIEHERETVVLVADGEISVLLAVSSTLEKAGFAVLTAERLDAAVELCARHEFVDLAIVDAAMADAEADLMLQLRRAQPGMRFLYTSDRGASEVPFVRPYDPARRYRGRLQKPFRRAQLLGRVLEAVDAPLAFTA